MQPGGDKTPVTGPVYGPMILNQLEYAYMIRFTRLPKTALLAGALAAALALPAHAVDITVTDAWAEVESDGVTVDVFMVISNSGKTMDTLYAANSAIAKSAKIGAISEEEEQKMEAAGQEGTQATALPVMPGERLILSEDGAQIELTDLTGKVNEGDKFDLTLFFENAGPVVVSVEVKDD